MDEYTAERLIRLSWLTIPEDELAVAFRILVERLENRTGQDWFVRNPYSTNNPERSCWEGLVKDANANLMTYRTCSFRGKIVYLNEEYVDELLA